MNNWFECKVKFDKTQDDGTIKSVNEPYLVDALSFTEAEARITEEVTPYITGDFTISNIKRVKTTDIFYNETGDRWFKAKVNYITLDEKSGAEKRTSAIMFIQSTDLVEALAGIHENMKGSIMDYEVYNITETAIMDVYPYGVKEEKPE